MLRQPITCLTLVVLGVWARVGFCGLGGGLWHDEQGNDRGRGFGSWALRARPRAFNSGSVECELTHFPTRILVTRCGVSSSFARRFR
jgi:hypothetical protein